MTIIHHINCGTLIAPGFPPVVCHSLLLEDENGLALVDSGIGLLDVKNPEERIGNELIEMGGFQFIEHDTACRRIENLGFNPSDIKHVLLTHCDCDHAGGMADFPNAQVHVSEEELAGSRSGHFRYRPIQFDHQPKWKTYGHEASEWFGLEARTVDLGFESEVLLIPLFGHTLGHCGIAIQQDEKWLLHVGDAYFLKAELTEEYHPVSALASQRATIDEQRIACLNELRRLYKDHSDEIEMVGYHDIEELPASLQKEIYSWYS